MEYTRFNLLLMQGLVILFVSVIVKSNYKTYIKDLEDGKLLEQIQTQNLDMGGSYTQNEQYYRLVLMVQEAVSRNLMSKVKDEPKPSGSDVSTALYNIPSLDINKPIRLPSTSDISKATEYFEKNPMSIPDEGSSSNPGPKLDKSESVDARAGEFIEAERLRLKQEKEADRALRRGEKSVSTDSSKDIPKCSITNGREEPSEATPPGTPFHTPMHTIQKQHDVQDEGGIHRRDGSTDSLTQNSEDFIKRHQKQLREESLQHPLTNTPLPSPLPTPLTLKNLPISDEPPSPDTNKAGCFGKCLSFTKDKTS